MKVKRVLNIEDTMEKHSAIFRSLKKVGIMDVDLAVDATQGLEMIETAIQDGKGYDLLITDMQFPINGEYNKEAGYYVIEELKNKNITIPTVVCSSIRYRISEVEGCIYYDVRNGDLDRDIRTIVKEIEQKL